MFMVLQEALLQMIGERRSRRLLKKHMMAPGRKLEMRRTRG